MSKEFDIIDKKEISSLPLASKLFNTVPGADDILSDALVTILRSDRLFLGYFIQQLNRNLTYEIPTLCVTISSDLTPQLYINPLFYYGLEVTPEKPCPICKKTIKCSCTGLSIPQKIAVLEHEVFHFLHKHLIRTGNRDLHIWNIAIDLAINQFIKNLPQGYTCSKCGLFYSKNTKTCHNCGGEVVEFKPWSIDNVVINNTRLDLNRNEPAEVYYAQIYKALPKIKIGSGSSTGNSNGKGVSNYWDEVSKKEDNSGNGLDIHDVWEEGVGDDEIIHEKVKNMTQNAQEKAESRQYGDTPAHYQNLINKILKHKSLPWRSILRGFVGDKEFSSWIPTRKRLNRRFGALQPGYKVQRKAHLVVITDSSGSISDVEFTRFAHEIDAIHSTGVSITVIECDAAVQNVFEYKTKLVNPSKKIKRRGYGGTDFVPAIDFVLKGGGITAHNEKKTISKPDAIVYLTDGEGQFPYYKIPIPTLWVGISSSSEEVFKRNGFNAEKHGKIIIMTKGKNEL